MKPKPIFKRISAFLLCFILLAGVLPAPALAEEDGGPLGQSVPAETEPAGGPAPPVEEDAVEEAPPANSGIMPLATTASASYIDASGRTETRETATVIDADTTEWSSSTTGGWYVVQDNVAISSRIDVSGNVHLILTDGCTLTASQGIRVSSGNSLTIYGQSGSTGTLTATGGSNQAGIGGNNEEDGGTITINGGTVTATSSYGGAGIGGGRGGNGGTTTVNGGIVIATGSYRSAGIGGGISLTSITGSGIISSVTGGNSGTITINGGTVTATGGDFSAGIGGAYYGGSGTITINGGTVTATGGGSGVGIGGGSSTNYGGAYSGSITISGGIVTANGYRYGIGQAGSFSTGNNGNAVIFTNSIQDSGDTSAWRGIIFQGDDGQVYGSSVTPTEDLEIPEGYTLTIDSGKTLTIDSDVTLTNRGTITNNGTIINNGTILNYGTINGTITNNGKILEPANVEISLDDVTNPVPYGSQVSITATVTSKSGDSINGGTVMFYQGEATGDPLNGDGTSVNNGTATYTINALDWTPGNYTITAVYTPTNDSGLLESSGTTQLNVTKAAQTTPPDAPSVSTTTPPTASSITLEAITTTGQSGVQYGYTTGEDSSVPENRWQTSTTFDDLMAATAYTFYARYAGNDNYEPSPASSVGTIIYTAHAAPIEGEGYTIDYAAETVTPNSDYEVRQTDSDEWTTDPINITPGGSFQVRHVAIERGAPASEETTVNVPPRPDAPDLKIDTEAEGVTISDEYYYNTTSGEYNADGWTQGTGSIIEVEPGNSIYIYQAATDSTFKSAVQTLTAPQRGTSPSVGIDYENEALSGTTTAMEYALGQSVPSQWTDCTENMALSELGWTGGEMTVYFRTAATATNYASVVVSLTIPARPEAPDAPTVTDWTDESITISAVDGVQYRLSDDGEWQSDTGGSLTFDNLYAGTAYTIYARYPAVTGDSPVFASMEVSTQVTTKTSAAAAPTVNVEEVTDTTITLSYDAAWEYSTDQQDWVSGEGANMFTGLTSATEYTFYVRVKETDTAEASDEAEVTVYTAHAAPKSGQGYSINYTEETITIENGYEVNTAQGFDGTSISSGDSVTSYIGQPLYIRHAADEDGAPASAGTAIPLTRPDAPAVQGVNETVAGQNDGRITGLTPGTAYEISSNNGQDWADATLTGTEITGLAPGTYQVRIKSTDSSFASEAVNVEIAIGDEPTYTLNVTAPAFDNVYTGYTQPEAKAITISSAGNSDATISDVAVDSEYFVIGGSGDTVPAGESIDTWTIQPAAGLSVGTYTATITVTYNDGTTATAQVSFTVTRRPSSGGGGGTTTYPPATEDTENGDVTVTPSRPEKGDAVTITPEPEEGYEVADVIVTDRNGNEVEVTDNGDGTWSFTQPSSAVTITVTFRPAESEPESLPFTDVPEGAWYEDAVRYVYENGLMSGTSATTFSPNATTTRGQIVTILWRMAGSPQADYLPDFSDVSGDAYYAEAVRWAASVGVADGYGNGLFGPNDAITREQMAAILYRFARHMGYDVTANADLSGYTDAAQISSYAVEAMRWANAEGLLTGTNATTLSPGGSATRAQIAVIMMRFCQRYAETAD